jgi:hypothetical protein
LNKQSKEESMTDLELIKDFRAGMAPPDDVGRSTARARLLAEMRSSTDTNEPAPMRRTRMARRPRWVALPLGLAAVAVVATAGIVLFGNGPATSTADAAVIHRAAAALAAPANEIFHYKLQGDGFVAESWQLTSAPYSFLVGKGPIGSVGYVSDDGTTVAHYDPTSNTISQSPSIKPPTPDDPLSEIKQELQNGQARVLGTSTLNGTPTYEIQLANNNGFDAQSMIAYVDENTYRPIELADPQKNGTIVNLDVVAFEYLPATQTNQNLLNLTARYPSAQVVADNSTPATTTTGK